MKKLFHIVVITLLASIPGLRAASVGAGGYTNAFAVQPAAADWSTFALAGGNTDIGTIAAMDTAVQGIAATSVTSQPTLDGTDPAAASGMAAWSSLGQYLQTRPTGNAASILMCTLVNNLGVDASGVALSYDFNKVAILGEEVDNMQVYYSLTGAAGSWTTIPAFHTAPAGRLSTTLNILWPQGSSLYILWADDNSVAASPDTAMQIDNFSAISTPANQVPVAFTAHPQNLAVAELSSASFSVTVSGIPAPTLQWYSNNVAIPGATTATYTIPSTPLSFHGTVFKVIAENVVTNITYSATSSVATLTVNADVVAPVLLSVSQAGNNQILAAFSEPLSAGSVGNLGNYTVTSSLGTLPITGAALDSSRTNVLLTVGTLTPAVTYTLTVNGITDPSAAANPVAPNSQATFTAAAVSYADIGAPAIGGTVTSVGNGYNVTAGGTNIAGAFDQFTLAYQQIAGDFDVKVRLTTLSPTDPWARAGLMARESLAAESRFAAALAGPSISGSFFQSRAATSSNAVISGWFPVNYPYTWLRLQRVGIAFNGFGSFDGQTWTQLGTISLAGMPSSVYLGFAASSANAGQATTAQFRDYQSAAGGVVATVPLSREPLGPSTRRTGLVISEIMYHPKSRPDGKVTEFIELYNSMSIFEDLSGYRISGDVDYTFANGTIMQPGQFILLAKVKADVESAYGISGVLQYGVTNGLKTNVVGNVTNIAPNIENSLNNSGGSVRLHNKAGAVILDAVFSTKYPWPIEADGGGHSLVLARPSYGEGYREAWGASDVIGGSPGTLDSIGSEPGRNVMINEFLAHTDPPFEDMIELYNHGNAPVDISGYWLSDDVGTNKYRIPNNTTLAPRGFIAFNQTTLGFALSSSGEQIVLVNSNQNRVIDAVGFEGQENGVATGRYPDGAPTFQRLSAITAGTTNAAPLSSPIVINEIMYNPITGNSDDEFVELYNRSANPVNIGNWGFTDGIDFNFPPNTIMAPGAYLVVAKDRTRLQANYSNLGPTNLFGNFSGSLANSGEHLELSAPDFTVTTNGSGQVLTNVNFRFSVNDVTYGTGGRWGNWSDGGGSSLELIDSQANNSLAANWSDSDDSAKSTWTSFEFTGNVDNQQTGQGNGDSLQLMMLGLGECIIDDIEVRNSANANVLPNGTFENGLTGWVLQGSHDQSFVEPTGGFTGRGLHLMAGSRGDNGQNRLRIPLTSPLTTGTGTMRGKARWLRGFPEVLLRLRGGGLEAFGRLPVPANLGTPGARNSKAVNNAGPAIYDVAHFPPLPAVSQPVIITARAHDANTVATLTVRYRIDPTTTFTSIPMVDNGTGGDAVAGDGLFTATIPGQVDGARAAFYLQGLDGTGVTGVFPANPTSRTFPNDSPSHECLVRWGEVQMPGSYATYHLWITDATLQRWTSRDRLNNAQLDGTFVYNNYRVVYNMMPQYGGSPWHVGSMVSPVATGTRVDSVANFPDDNRLLGATDFVLNTVGNPGGNTSSDTSAMAEQTSYEFFKAIGVHYNYRRYIHFFINGSQRSITGDRPGNFIMEDSQQPNGDQIREYFPDDSEGQLYKIEDWFEFPDDGGQSGTKSNDDADLQRRNTTYNGVTTIKVAPYRFMWRKRSVSAAESANNYTNLLSLVDIISPVTNATISPLPDYLVKQLGQVIDFEQWMRIFAVQRTVGNWDSYGYNRGKNAYTYRPNFGKFNQWTWDIDFTMGIGGDGPQTGLFGSTDQRVVAMQNTPEIVRAYWRAFQDILSGPLSSSYMDPLLDARAKAHAANNVNYNPAQVNTIKNYITARRAYIQSQMPSAAFSITGPSSFTTSSNVVTVTGTAPIDIKFIEIDGVRYPVTWTSTTGWSLRLPMTVAGMNNFTLTASDRLGNLISGTTRSITVNYTGTVELPQDNIVFNELMFSPSLPDTEYVELFNRSASFTFDLGGWRINGLDYTFPEGTVMAPRSYLVLTKDRIAFANAYGGTVPVFDQFPGGLQSDGETLTLIKPGATPAQDLIVDKVRYEAAAPWSTNANFSGSSMQLIDPNQDNSRVGNWYSIFTPAVYTPAVSTPASPRDGWRFFSANGTTAGGAAQRLLIFLGESGSAIIDDLSVVLGSNAAVGFNYVANGDFEAPLVLDPAITNRWALGTNYTNSLIISDLVHSGNGALKIVGESPGAAVSPFARVIYQFVSGLPAGSNATLSFWYWATNSATNLYVRILNSSGLTTGPANGPTNINVFITPTNYVPPQLVTPATNVYSPGVANQGTTNLPAFPTLWINEVQAENVSRFLDNNGQREPWIEIYNRSTNTVSLDGLYLSTNYANLTQWAFPAGYSIGPTQFLVVICDAQVGQTTPAQLHTSFRLPIAAGSVALSRLYTNAPQVIDYVNYSGLHSDRSYGSFPDGQSFDRQEFFYVTPGARNDGRSAPLVVFINEWMAGNLSYLADPADNDYDDWFELYNPSTNAVDIAGYYLTDVLTNKTKYLITTAGPHIIPGRGYLLVWADNESGQNSSGGVPRADLHVDFQLALGGEAIGLFAADGTQIDAISFTQQTNDISQGRYTDGGPSIYSMTFPTPRAANVVPGVGNNPPILGAIGPKSIFVGQTLAFTATAADPDPGQTRTFSLGAGAPGGASINPTTGAFSWSPTVATTNVITVIVTDNGAGALTDFENVVVRVLNPPGFSNSERNGNDFTMKWTAIPGRTYRVEYKNDLNTPTWTPLGQDLTTDTETQLSITVDVTASPKRFYHLLVLP